MIHILDVKPSFILNISLQEIKNKMKLLNDAFSGQNHHSIDTGAHNFIDAFSPGTPFVISTDIKDNFKTNLHFFISFC